MTEGNQQKHIFSGASDSLHILEQKQRKKTSRFAKTRRGNYLGSEREKCVLFLSG